MASKTVKYSTARIPARSPKWPGEEHQEQSASRLAQTDVQKRRARWRGPCSPSRHIGKPSNVAAIEAGEPGTSRQQADEAAGRSADINAGQSPQGRQRILKPVGESVGP